LFYRKKSGDEDNEDLQRWLLTYADLITLLLAFFIVMYSMSRVDAGKFKRVTEALSSVLKGPDELFQATVKDISSELFINRRLKKGDLIVLKKRIDDISRQLGLGMQLSTELQTRGLVIHISESAFFDLGKADLKSKAKNILDLISIQLLKVPNHIRVEGHTDNLPINTPKFPSNWELSTTRATVCLRYLIEKHDFPPERISALGYAEFRPITSNKTEQGRAKNRRVDIVVLALEDSFKEPENISGEQVEPQSEVISNGTSQSNSKIQ